MRWRLGCHVRRDAPFGVLYHLSGVFNGLDCSRVKRYDLNVWKISAVARRQIHRAPESYSPQHSSFVVRRDSERNPLHLIEGNLIGAPVVECSGPRGFMAGHLLGDLELAVVLQVGGDPDGAELWALILVRSPAARARS
jgi:hypothetical protein